jgi:hypothetical protein
MNLDDYNNFIIKMDTPSFNKINETNLDDYNKLIMKLDVNNIINQEGVLNYDNPTLDNYNELISKLDVHKSYEPISNIPSTSSRLQYNKSHSKFEDEPKLVNQTTTTFNGSNYLINKETISVNEIIDPKKYLNPIESYNTNIARSNLNNLKRKVITQTLIFNSIYREDYLHTMSTDFTINLPTYLKNVLSMRLSSLQIPNVIYCISSKKQNNQMYITDPSNNLSHVIFPDGNYSISEFVAILKTLLTPLDPLYDVSYNHYTQQITINNTNTFKMNFTHNIEINTGNIYKTHNTSCIGTQQVVDVSNCNFVSNSTFVHNQHNCNNININQAYNTLGWIMGYRKTSYSKLKSYTTEGLYNGLATDYIYFNLNDFNNSQSQSIVGLFSNSMVSNNNSSTSNILGMIPLTSNNWQVCFVNGNDLIEKKREYFGPVNIYKLKVQLLDQYGNIIDLNNMDFSFSIETETGYDW